MFDIQQRDALRERVLRLATNDDRVVAGAAVGSLAVDEGDRFSDLDLTFGIADPSPSARSSPTGRARSSRSWTRCSLPISSAAHHLPGVPAARSVQLDLSLTPAPQFRPAGPRFRLVFGETAGRGRARQPPVAEDLFGWGVIYALHARACIERRRVWQAEHYVCAVRDHALSLACLRLGTTCRTGAWIRRPARRDPCSIRAGACRRSRARAAPESPLRLGLGALGRGDESGSARCSVVAGRIAELR